MSTYVSANANDIISIRPVIEPVAGAATYTTTWMRASLAYQWLMIISAGTVGTSVDAKVEQATDNSGTDAKDLSGSAITQLTAAGTAAIQFKPIDLDIDNDFEFVRLSITTVGASTVASGHVLALGTMYEPQANTGQVDEVVTV